MRSGNRLVWIIAGIAVAFLAFVMETHAQSHEGFIYGKVYTNRNTYTGPIRWGKEEVLWTDLFNAAKTDKSFDKLVPKEKSAESWGDYNWSFGSIWEDNTQHQFTSQFGNFKEMVILNDEDVLIRLKNGGEIKVEDDGNDIGEKIQVMDPELGVISIDWDNIDRVEFLPTPTKLNQVFGMPLYGTVEGVRKEKYTGFIVWDNDERLTTDKLDGDSEDGDVSIPFSEIISIERRGGGSYVITKSGRELRLTGSNDVDDDNRGIFVVSPEVGVIKFSWESFRKLTLAAPKNTGPSFNDFSMPRIMTGTISRLDGKDVTGQIVFDIDETMDFEIIEGVENDIEYFVPLKNIKSITPKNYDYSQVDLVSGQSLLLGEGRDVSARNAGLLVFEKGKKDPVYISWRKVNQITFN
ncbi:MAG TPA: hypothetical protein VK508_11060 [Cyclobacteriaceae bacterium]|nr:hypothetical protein [Cyclobacteriaceae bacterium]